MLPQCFSFGLSKFSHLCVTPCKQAKIVKIGSSRLPAGLVWFIPWLDAIQTVDLRTMFFNIWPQEVSSILRSLKAWTHWPLFPYKDKVCKVSTWPAQNQLLFFHNNRLKLFVSAHWCFVTSPCLLLSPGLDCGCSAVKGGRCCVFLGGRPLHVGDACCKWPPGHVLAGPDDSEDHDRCSHSGGRVNAEAGRGKEDGSEWDTVAVGIVAVFKSGRVLQANTVDGCLMGV